MGLLSTLRESWCLELKEIVKFPKSHPPGIQEIKLDLLDSTSSVDVSDTLHSLFKREWVLRTLSMPVERHWYAL